MAATSRLLSAYGRTLEMVSSSKYLGRAISVADDDCPAVIHNLVKACAVWRRMTKILSREGARPPVSGFFFKAAVQSVLLFGADTWVVAPCMGRVLGGFQYRRTLEMVSSSKYLGRAISVADDDCPAVIHNLVKACAVWRRMTKILSREGARPPVSGFFFKAAVQSVLLFGADTWVVAPCMGRVLGGFQYQVDRRLTRKLPHWRSDVRW